MLMRSACIERNTRRKAAIISETTESDPRRRSTIANRIQRGFSRERQVQREVAEFVGRKLCIIILNIMANFALFGTG